MKTYNQLICVSAAMLLVLIVVAQVQAEETGRDGPLGLPCVTKPAQEARARPRARAEVETAAAQAVRNYRSTLSQSQDQLKN
jgi:hypothetical protein